MRQTVDRHPIAVVRAVREDHVADEYLIRCVSRNQLTLDLACVTSIPWMSQKSRDQSRRCRREELWHLRDGARLSAARGLPPVEILVSASKAGLTWKLLIKKPDESPSQSTFRSLVLPDNPQDAQFCYDRRSQCDG